MESRLKNINSFWGYLLIDELVRNGITCFCISPGSRSTPLTIAAAENPGTENIVCIDERSSAYYALGYGRATGKPAALICTSGTAVASYYPAVIEAHQSNIPLIVLTADRPPELRSTGANQTIDQIKIFSDYPKWFFDLPCPDPEIPARVLLTTIDQAVYQAKKINAGPVHINCMFREPLEPSNKRFPYAYSRSVKKWERLRAPYTEYEATYLIPDMSQMKELSYRLNGAKKGILVIGELPDEEAGETVVELAARLRWPVFADITSGIRGGFNRISIIKHYDHLFLSEKVKNFLQPKIILHIGRPLNSKRYLQFIQNFPPHRYVQISQSEGRHDPTHQISNKFHTNISAFTRQLLPLTGGNVDKSWHMKICEFDMKIKEVLKNALHINSNISEISLPAYISERMEANHGLFLASSMPVRDFDMYAMFGKAAPYIASNRGASGIDGTLATAVGYARGIKKPVTVVLGDLALIHDMNSLLLVNGSEFPITIVVINNGGGGIFSFLPVAKFAHVFEQYFGAAHDYEFKHLAKMFNLRYFNPATNREFAESYRKCLSSKNSALIEIKTDRNKNLLLHQEIQKKVKTVLEK